MPFVTEKPKFQVTIPALLRKDIDLRDGDIMEATLVGDAIPFKPRAVVERHAAADRIAAKFATSRTSSDDTRHGIDRIDDHLVVETQIVLGKIASYQVPL